MSVGNPAAPFSLPLWLLILIKLTSCTIDSEDQKKKFSEDPTYYLKYRKDVEMSMSDFFLIHKNTPSNQRFTEVCVPTIHITLFNGSSNRSKAGQGRYVG